MITRFAFLLCLLATAITQPGQAQPGTRLTGQVLDQATQAPVPYASLGVLHQPLGTVADDQGRFAFDVPLANDSDSVRIALLGYAPLTLQVRALRQRLAPAGGGPLLLRATPMALAEVVVRPGQLTRRVIGNSSNSANVTATFDVNKIGNQLGQGMYVRRPALLEQVSFHVAHCTYDSLFYRVNVYQVVKGEPTANLLPEPVYVRVRKGQIKDRFVVDLRRFQLTVQGHLAVTLEMVKDLGPGTLHLSASLLNGPIYLADQSASGWERLRGFGLGIDATVAEYR